MPRCQVTLTANTGVLIECNGIKVCCDAFHDDKAVEFSTVTPEMQRHISESPQFQNPDMILYTHDHRDHYTLPAAQWAQRLWPDAAMVSPMPELKNDLLLQADSHALTLGRAKFWFKHLRHDGKEYIDLPNYACLMDLDGFRVLLLGDCVICNPALTEWLDGTSIDLALLNFPWLTLKRGRAYIADVLRPRHVMFYHLPFAEDDHNGYRASTAKSLPLLTTPKNARILQEPFQTEAVD